MIRTLLATLPLTLLLAGCVSATVEEVRSGATGMRDTDQVVVLGRRHNNGYETEPDFVSCVGNSLGSGRDGIAVLPERQFVDTLFPFFEPRTAPLEIRDLPSLMANEMVATRLQEQGVRYLVWLDGSTSTNDTSGSMTCAVSPAGGGCFGFVTWDRESTYEASIWDLETMTSVGKISTDASGTSYMPAVILPVPLIARVQSSACGGMATQLKAFLHSKG
ncbi:MAG: hypothetical protein JJT88_11970 [Gammaproteobacteria bacterium]|jgi:hypothetical protein|nr:hypothetical protein [Gammaproteobacteria bacterium]